MIDTQLIASLAELGSTALLIYWLMRSDLSRTERLRETQDKFLEHLQEDINLERQDKESK